MTRIIGYARVSTDDQNLDMQQIAIEKYAKDKNLELVMYLEKISSRKDQPELKNALKAIAKFEAKYGETKISTETKAEIQVKLELIGIKNPGETTIQPVLQEQPKVVSETIVKAENQTSSKETEVQQNTDKKSLKEEQKTEKKALQEEHKAEMKALKEEHKAENKALKEKNKEVKKNGKDKE